MSEDGLVFHEIRSAEELHNYEEIVQKKWVLEDDGRLRMETVCGVDSRIKKS